MVIQLGNKIGKCYFKEAYPEMVYTKDGERTDEQAKEPQGIVPLWRVKAELSQDGKTTEMITVSVPLDRNPAEGLQLNEEIVFVGLRIESGNRRNGGRWEKLISSGIVRKKRESKE